MISQCWFRWWLGAVRASHHLNQCWPRSMSPYGVAWPQWVKQELISWVATRQLLFVCTHKSDPYQSTWHLSTIDTVQSQNSGCHLYWRFQLNKLVNLNWKFTQCPCLISEVHLVLDLTIITHPYYHSLSTNSNAGPHISKCNLENLQNQMQGGSWPSLRFFLRNIQNKSLLLGLPYIRELTVLSNL